MHAEDVIAEVVMLCKRHMAFRVILFGSRAKGTCRERSDIDIAVSEVDDFDLLSEEVEMLSTLYTVDLINLDECQNNLLLEDIELYGREVYKKV